MLLLLAACAPEYGLSTVPAPLPDEEGFAPVSVEDDGGSAVSAEEAPDRGERRETFLLGARTPTPVADFLFVVDESASMRGVVARVREAFADLGDGGAFPVEARVAVMGMIPGDPDDLGRAHPAVGHGRRNRLGPGFLRLVQRATIDEFSAVAPVAQLARFAHRGCDDAWFAPGDVDDDGVPCLVGHTQISMDVIQAEAGLTAFAQLLERRGDSPLFRPGAAANVIFVSDTQDPGLPHDDPHLDDLVALRPDHEELTALVDEANDVASFRVHAIVPDSACGEGWSHLGTVYQDVAEASGGRTLDVCTARDYRAFVEAIGHEGSTPTRAVLALGRTATEVDVAIGGETVGGRLTGGGRAVVLDRALPERITPVTVTYRVAR